MQRELAEREGIRRKDRPAVPFGEVHRHSQEPARVRGIWRDRIRKNPNRERLGFNSGGPGGIELLLESRIHT